MPEREHAGVADEDVERDDDRHRHERVDEVDLRLAREREPTSPAATTSAAGPSSRGSRAGRFIPAPPPRPARTDRLADDQSTRITSPKTHRRQVLALVGRQRAPEQARRRSRSRSRPASRRARPPHPSENDAREHDDRVAAARTPGSRAASGPSAARRPPPRAGRRRERRRRSHGSRGTPSSRAVRKSSAAARMCRPMRVRSSSSTSRARQAAATTIATIVILRTSTPPTSIGRFSETSDVAGLPSGPNQRSATLWSRNATANVATSITAGDWVAQRPEDEPLHEHCQRDTTAKQRTMPAHAGQSHSDASASANAPAMISWPYAKLTSLQHAEDEADADGHQRVDGAQPDRVDDGLRVERADERRVTTGRRPPSAPCRRRRRGSRTRRSSPFASRYVRSASATVRCARCSTSSTADAPLADRRERLEDDVHQPSARARATARRAAVRPVRRRARGRSRAAAAGHRRAAPARRRPNSSTTGNSSERRIEVASALHAERRPASPSRRFSSTRQLGVDAPALGDERDTVTRDGLRRATPKRPTVRAGRHPRGSGRRP